MLLNARSERNLIGVHPDLVRVVRRAAADLTDASGWGFVVTEGLRTAERQKELVAQGASWTMNSRHLTGHAVDLCVYIKGPTDIRWEWPLYVRLNDYMLRCAVKEDVQLEWGGSWKSRDGPHFQLPWSVYKA